MRRFAGLLICLCAVAAAADEVRTWTKAQGETFQAQLLREVDGEAVFLKDGKPYTIPFDQLSEKDQKLIRDLEKEKKVEETPAPLGAPAAKVESLPPSDEPAAKSDGKTDGKSDGKPDRRPSLVPQKMVPETRVWRDVHGKQYSGKYVRMRDRNVTIGRPVSRPYEVPFSSLSREDQQYLRRLLAARGEGHLCPPASDDNPEFIPDTAIAPAPTTNTATEFPDGAPDLTGPTIAGRTPLHEQSRARFGLPIHPGDMPSEDESAPAEKSPGNQDVVALQPAPEVAEAPTASRIQWPQLPKLTAQQIGAGLCVLVFGLVIGSAIGSVILRTAIALFNAVTGVGNSRDAVPEPTYGEGMGIIFVTMIVNTVAGVVAGIAIGFGCAAAGVAEHAQMYARIVSMPLGIVVMSSMFSSMLPTTFFRALLITICYIVVWIFIIAVIVVGMIAIFGLPAH